jgi:hypothetical protein
MSPKCALSSDRLVRFESTLALSGSIEFFSGNPSVSFGFAAPFAVLSFTLGFNSGSDREALFSSLASRRPDSVISSFESALVESLSVDMA